MNGDGGIGGSATQHVDLNGHAGEPFEFSTWLASRFSTPPVNDSDYAIVVLEFLSAPNATGEVLGTIRFDGNDQQGAFIVGSANEQGIADLMIPATQDNWTFFRGTGRIPSNAVSAAVTLRNGTIDDQGDSGYVDLVSLRVIPEPLDFPGDYNGDNAVEQEDLDLVLLNWGNDATVAPDGWNRNFPTGAVDQAELDAVLLNWGNTQPTMNGAGAIPEPATASLVLALLPFVVAIRRAQARRKL